ncbi:TolC family protein [Loktanella sp. 3ANDIMAR09]|uniref:TolC family protein n=1 Tax=Loktanella sp. 3ANDIMAR09 TaxID=1225657 RepID=UPI001C0F5392|nr:TolC family protein [Loktanella sp. 3ANDIMAR09]
MARAQGAPLDFAGAAAAPTMDATLPGGDTSDIIAGLKARRTVLNDGLYAGVAHAAVSNRTSQAEQDLRAARFRAQAQSKNWLPSMGPQVSLSSVGSLVTTLFIEQTILDNGRNKAERAYANAEVEVASVTYAQDANDRAFEALNLLLTAQAAEARAAVNAAALPQLERYAYIMDERVKGGVSNPVDASIVHQKLQEMRADRDLDLEGAASARAELAAMTGAPVTGSTTDAVFRTELTAQPLPDLKAEAEATLAGAEADAGRAGFFPRLAGIASIGDSSDVGLTAQMDQDIGFGTRDAMRAIEAQRVAAIAAVSETREDTARTLAKLEAERSSLTRQLAQAEQLAEGAAQTFNTYVQAQRDGQRTVREVVTLMESRVGTARRAASLRYDIIRNDLKTAALRGVLVDGDIL